MQVPRAHSARRQVPQRSMTRRGCTTFRRLIPAPATFDNMRWPMRLSRRKSLQERKILVSADAWSAIIYCQKSAHEKGHPVPKPQHIKTNAMRALEARHIAFETFTYPSTIHAADEVASLLHVPASEVFKALVMLTDGGKQLLVMVPGDSEVDVRLLARSIGVKSVRMASQRDAERLTGLLVGGISPLALLGRHFEVYLDARAGALEHLYLNGGQRGVNVRLAVADLQIVTGARLVEATVPVPTP